MGAWKPPTCFLLDIGMIGEVSIHGGVEAPNFLGAAFSNVNFKFQYMGAWKPPTFPVRAYAHFILFQYMGAWKPPTTRSRTNPCA